MENASKALIIAGSILLAIAIIGIGMAVFNMANEQAGAGDLSEYEISSYNSKFMGYEGIQNGATVKTMLNTIRTHNQTNNNDTSRQIVVTTNNTDLDGSGKVGDNTDGTTAADINTTRNDINSGTRYRISFDYTSTGLIKQININSNI